MTSNGREDATDLVHASDLRFFLANLAYGLALQLNPQSASGRRERAEALGAIAFIRKAGTSGSPAITVSAAWQSASHFGMDSNLTYGASPENQALHRIGLNLSAENRATR